MSESRALPAGWPVLVTGAGGFVGGHVARHLAAAGYQVRAWTRREPVVRPGDPPLEWFRGDLCDRADRAEALRGVLGVVHVAGWVSLGRDPSGRSRRVNVDATRDLLGRCAEGAVERFVYTSTLWTTAAGTPARPADESAPWNLEAVRSPYSETKREAERLVLGHDGPSLRTSALCPGLVAGPRDARPTSTGLFLRLSRARVAVLPSGGIPLVDAGVLALAHRRALEAGGPGRRYIVAGDYLSYLEIAALVRRLTGRPRHVITLPDRLEAPLRALAGRVARLAGGRAGDLSEALVAGGFLRLHALGRRADTEFGLRHPDPARSIHEALDDHRRAGRAPWLERLGSPDPDGPADASPPSQPGPSGVDVP